MQNMKTVWNKGKRKYTFSCKHCGKINHVSSYRRVFCNKKCYNASSYKKSLIYKNIHAFIPKRNYVDGLLECTKCHKLKLEDDFYSRHYKNTSVKRGSCKKCWTKSTVNYQRIHKVKSEKWLYNLLKRKEYCLQNYLSEGGESNAK